MESCCFTAVRSAYREGTTGTYGDLHSLPADQLHAAHDVFLHLHKLGELLRKVWAKGAGSSFSERMSYFSSSVSPEYVAEARCCSPKLPRPNRRPCFVEDDGGGGFSIWEAVGARDWRIEYVRCILKSGRWFADGEKVMWGLCARAQLRHSRQATDGQGVAVSCARSVSNQHRKLS
jgi:hypothetical protein